MVLLAEMTPYNHIPWLRIVGETEPTSCNRVELAEEKDQCGLRNPRMTLCYSVNDRKLMTPSSGSMRAVVEVAIAEELWVVNDSNLRGDCRMGDDPNDNVVNRDGRSRSIPNLWVRDGSLVPTSGGVTPSLTIQALACRLAQGGKL